MKGRSEIRFLLQVNRNSFAGCIMPIAFLRFGIRIMFLVVHSCEWITTWKGQKKKNCHMSTTVQLKTVHHRRVMGVWHDSNMANTAGKQLLHFQLLLDFECWMSHWSVISGIKETCWVSLRIGLWFMYFQFTWNTVLVKLHRTLLLVTMIHLT